MPALLAVVVPLVIVAATAVWLVDLLDGSPPRVWRDGARMADADIAAGRLVLKKSIWLRRPAWSDEYDMLLHDRFGVVTERYLPDHRLDHDPDLYNERMREELHRRFGEGVLDLVAEQAAAAFAKRRAAARGGD